MEFEISDEPEYPPADEEGGQTTKSQADGHFPLVSDRHWQDRAVHIPEEEG